jgi:anaerobic selenocysteine-containing dehydrogenase
MKDEVSRRQFLGTVAAGAGTAALSTTVDAKPHPPGWHGSSRVEKIATNCEMCFWRRGVLASVSDGKVVRLEGNWSATPRLLSTLC